MTPMDAYTVSKLPRYRAGARGAVVEIREAWRGYLAAIEEARAMDRRAPGEPVGGREGGFWTPSLLELAREHAGRLVEVRMECLKRRLQALREYRDAIRFAEQARAAMAPGVVELRAAA